MVTMMSKMTMMMMMMMMEMLGIRSALQRAEIKSRQCLLRTHDGATDLQTSNIKPFKSVGIR